MRSPTPRIAALTTATKASYAVGNLGLQMLVAAMGMLLMFFYTDVAKVSPAVAGAALMVGKVWDTINDPLFGWMADRTRTRHGRYRTWLVWGAAPLALVAAAVWMVPGGLSPVAAFLWIVFTYTLFDTVMTLVQLPYSAMAAELTRQYDERTSLTTWASAGALAGYLGGAVLMPVLVRIPADARSGYAFGGGMLGLTAGVCVAFVAWRVREPDDSAAQSASVPWQMLRRQFRSALGHRPFVALLAAAGLVRLGLTVVQTSLAYFVVYRLAGTPADLPRHMGLMLAVVGLSLLFWKRVIDRWEKSYTYMAGLLLCAAGLATLYFLRPGQGWVMNGALVATGLGMGAHWIAPYAMLPDTVDDGHARHGDRSTGIYYGIFGLVDKLARTLATGVVALVLDLSEYVPQAVQSERALHGISLVTGLIPALCVALAVPALALYPITRASHERLRDSLRRRP